MASSLCEKLSLPEVLSKTTVIELRKLARGLYVKGSSAMRKNDLISSVFSSLLVPERLEELLYVIDDETWTLFQAAYEKESVLLSGQLPDNFMLLKELCYLVQEPNSYEQIVYMTGEIKALFSELISGGFLHRRQYYTDLHTYALAAVNLYGVIAKTDFIGIFNLQNEKQTNIDEVCAVLPRYIEVGAPYCFWEDYIVSIEFDENNFSDVQDLLRQVGNKPRFLPDKTDFLKYADWYFFERTHQTEEVKRYLINHLRVNEATALEILGEIHFAFVVEAGIQAAVDVLDEFGISITDSQLEPLTQLLVQMSNSTRLWSNNGHTPDEMADLMPRMVDGIRHSRKIGRNELCPCGSGKKYKKCCGR